MRRSAAVVGAVLLTVSLGQPASAAPAGRCPNPGFETLTEGQFVQQQVALGLPAERLPELRAFLAATDRNGDDIVCSRDLPDKGKNTPRSRIVLDNKAPA